MYIYEGSPEEETLKKIAPEVTKEVEKQYADAITAIHNEGNIICTLLKI